MVIAQDYYNISNKYLETYKFKVEELYSRKAMIELASKEKNEKEKELLWNDVFNFCS